MQIGAIGQQRTPREEVRPRGARSALAVAWMVAVVACSPAPQPEPAPPAAAPAPVAPAAEDPAAAPAPSVPAAPPTSPPAAPSTPQPGPAAEEDLPAAERAAAEAFGKDLESALRAGDVSRVAAAFDTQAIVDAVCAGIQLPERKLADFRTGLVTGMGRSTVQLAGQWKEQDPTFKRIVRRDGRTWARFRFVSEESGIGIVDLRLRTTPRGTAIDDFRNQSIGAELVEGARQSMLPLLASLDRGILERIVGGPGITAKDTENLGKFAQQVLGGDGAGALATYAALPALLRDTLPVTNLHIAALQRSGDDDAYAEALRRAAARFPPPHFRFALVDVHFLEKRYDRAVACIDEFMAVADRDAALLTLRALMQKESGDVAAAHATLVEALTAEPTCRFAHEKGLDVLLAARDFAGTAESIRFLEGLGGYTFKGHLDDPLWAEFRAAPESEPWR